nr:MAG TPA: hypothetical protein [Caudoviricetes sp.]
MRAIAKLNSGKSPKFSLLILLSARLRNLRKTT